MAMYCYKVSQQITHTNHTYKSHIQTTHTNHTYKPHIQTTHTNHTYKPHKLQTMCVIPYMFNYHSINLRRYKTSTLYCRFFYIV